MTKLDTLTQALLDDKNKSGYKKKIYDTKNNSSNYKVQSDEHKLEILNNDINMRINDLMNNDIKGKVDFKSLKDVQDRSYKYLLACSQTGVYPSIMGLSVQAYGVSRQALNQYLHNHRTDKNNEIVDFIEQIKDVIADILVNQSLHNNANSVQAIFQLKNHFNHTDKVEIAPIIEDNGQSQYERTTEEIRRKYIGLDVSEEQIKEETDKRFIERNLSGIITNN